MEDNNLTDLEETKKNLNTELDDDVMKMFDLSTSKKKKSKKSSKDEKKEKKKDNHDESNEINDELKQKEDNERMHPDGIPNYTYEQLLERINEKLGRNDKDFDLNKRKSVPLPEIERLGTTKTIWKNFLLTSKALNRNIEHIMKFFLHDLGVEGSLNEDKELIFKGRFTVKQIEPILRKYIHHYVACSNCFSLNTQLKRDKIVSLIFIFCDNCHSQKTVQNIKAGYHAETKADRKAMRQQN